jgi:hypothetical protein
MGDTLASLPAAFKGGIGGGCAMRTSAWMKGEAGAGRGVFGIVVWLTIG